MKKIVATLLTIATISLAAKTAVSDNVLKTHAELGYINTSGNTDTESFSGVLNINKTFGDHMFRFDAEGFYSDDNGVETKNRWKSVGNYDYPAAETIQFNYLIGYEEDKFSGYDSQFYTGPGIKWRAILPPEHQLDLQANILYSSDSVEGLDTDDYASVQAKLDYIWYLDERWKFIQIAFYRVDVEEPDNYFFNSRTAVESRITTMFSLGASYTVDYKNQAPEGKKRYDRTFLLSLIIDYAPVLPF